MMIYILEISIIYIKYVTLYITEHKKKFHMDASHSVNVG